MEVMLEAPRHKSATLKSTTKTLAVIRASRTFSPNEGPLSAKANIIFPEKQLAVTKFYKIISASF
jgi:hypothetical protein